MNSFLLLSFFFLFIVFSCCTFLDDTGKFSSLRVGSMPSNLEEIQILLTNFVTLPWNTEIKMKSRMYHEYQN